MSFQSFKNINLGLKQKLVLMILPVLIGLMVFSFNQIMNDWNTLDEMESFQTVAGLGVASSSLVHELQKERGLSAGFVGSGGKKFSDKIVLQRSKVDQAYDAYKSTLVSIDMTALPPELLTAIETSSGHMEHIAAMREKISDLNIRVSEVVGYYTEVNASFLKGIGLLGSTTHNYKLVTDVLAFTNFLQSKERAGIERAVLAAAFGADELKPGVFKKYMTLKTEQDTYLNVFNAIANEGFRKIVSEIVVGDVLVRVGEFRAILESKSRNFNVDATDWFHVQTGKINLLKKAEDQLAGAFIQNADEMASDALVTLIAILTITILLLFVSAIISFYVLNSILGNVNRAVVISNAISEGDFSNEIDTSLHDEIGMLLKALEKMQSVLFAQIVAEKEEMLRIKTALDQVSGNVMIADADYNIFYINNKANELMHDAENDFRKALPNFQANGLMGSCIDVFHKNPGHQRRLLDSLTQSYRSSDMNIGGRVMQVVANPVNNDRGERIATVVEWIDRTEEARVELEVQEIVGSAKAGDLSRRIDTTGKSGFFESLSDGINELVDVSERVINDTLRVLSAMADGNLTESIDNEYEGSFSELKENANATITKLRDLIGQVRSTATDVSGGSSEMASSNATLNDRTQEQAAALEETASSIEEMSSTLQQNADNARQANQLAVNTREQAELGGEVASQAVEAMVGITTSSKKISDIISVIDEIAFQTNLLALNAAVEAARAGEQGRGFAVVASEVRALAQRSAGAAKEIKALINQSVEAVNEGSGLVDKSGEALTTIVQSVQKVGDIIAEIAAAGQEQATGVDQINQAISQMDNVTQQNAALVEETAAGSEQLEHQAKEMLELVSAFDLGDGTGQVSRVERTRAVKKVAVKKSAKAKPQSASRNDDE